METSIRIAGTEISATQAQWISENGKTASMFSCSFPTLFDTPSEGDLIELSVGGQGCFVGYIFSVSENQHECTIQAYDQLRYFMFKDSYVFSQKTVGDIVETIAKDMGLSIGDIYKGSYSMDLVAEDKKLLDVIQKAILMERENTGTELILLDDLGEITLTEKEQLVLDVILSPDSLLERYRYQQSINTDTFNRVKLARKSKNKGSRIVTIQQQEGKIQEWGTLQYYEKVDEKLTTAQVQAMAQAILSQKARPTKQMILNAIGEPLCRAGYTVSVETDAMSGRCCIERAIHTWRGATYRMELYTALEGE